jgi:hypothetical protein
MRIPHAAGHTEAAKEGFDDVTLRLLAGSDNPRASSATAASRPG